MPQALTPRRIWTALLAVAVLSFAGCAGGAVDCAIFRPLGLGAALGAAAISLFDSSQPPADESEADVEDLPYRPARR